MTRRSDSTPPPAEERPIPPELVGVFRALAEQHREAASLIRQIQATPTRRAVLWPTLRRALVSHEHSEVRELFPVLRQREQTRPLADHHDEEARDLDALIGRLDRMPDALEAWGVLFDQLAQTVLAHADEEETSIFPAAQEVLGQLQSQQLEMTVLMANQKLKQLA